MARIPESVDKVERELLVNEHAATYLKGVLYFNRDSRKWERGDQPLTEEEFKNTVNAGILEALSQILTELKVNTYYLSQGLNVKDDPESIRNELSNIF